jgi:two-component system, cell cycle sensor histidine kinase and response regulator CckA
MNQSLRRLSSFFRKLHAGQAPLVAPGADMSKAMRHTSLYDVLWCAEPGSVKPLSAPAQTQPTDASLQTNIETVLLVEDEAIVRHMASEILSINGYCVLEAQHGPEALEVASQHQGRIDLLLTDVIMPLMSGRVLAECLQAERPDTRILYVSGYTDDVLTDASSHDAAFAFLQKPFTPDTLAAKVRSVLDARPG